MYRYECYVRTLFNNFEIRRVKEREKTFFRTYYIIFILSNVSFGSKKFTSSDELVPERFPTFFPYYGTLVWQHSRATRTVQYIFLNT